MAENPARADAPPAEGVTAPVGAGPGLVAAVLSVTWVGLVAVYLLVLAPASGTAAWLATSVVAVLLPVALIWTIATILRRLRRLRGELQRQQGALEQMRQAILADRQAARLAATGIATEAVIRVAPENASGVDPGAAARLAEIAQAGRAVDMPLATFVTTREAPRPRPSQPARAAEEQPSLALGPMAEDRAPPLDRADLIRALNFPDTERDTEGFAALRRALRDRRTRQLIQASQDVLTLLSQDGIYMDDLAPDRARPEVWRRFARGERGRTVAALGGVRDRSCLALTTGRMRQDTIFRDAAHHFLRLFDRMLAAIEPEASDEDISRLSETRTARAFMLIGRVTGAFD